MENSRMTANDYRKKYDGLVNEIIGVQKRVANRLLRLAEEHPDAPVQQMGDTIIKAKTIANIRDINVIGLDAQIKMIDKIEKWLADQHPHQQLELFN